MSVCSVALYGSELRFINSYIDIHSKSSAQCIIVSTVSNLYPHTYNIHIFTEAVQYSAISNPDDVQEPPKNKAWNAVAQGFNG